jgi:hypothetical protein
VTGPYPWPVTATTDPLSDAPTGAPTDRRAALVGPDGYRVFDGGMGTML